MRTSVPLLALLLRLITVKGRDLLSPDQPPVLNSRDEFEVEISNDGTVTYDCLPSCEFDGTTTSKRLARRWAEAANQNLSDEEDWTEVLHGNTTNQALQKRQWKLSSNGQLFAAQAPYSISDVNEYVYNQVQETQGTFDAQYGAYRGLVSGQDERAVSQHNVFGKKKFQLGTNGIHGCQVVTVISPRGAWMAHFWESYTNGKPNSDYLGTTSRLSPGGQAFKERMVNFLTGVDITTGGPGVYTEAYPEGKKATKIHPFLVPQGQSLQRNAAYLTTGNEGADIKVFIATPRDDEETEELKYPDRVAFVSKALREYLGNAISITIYPYERLNTRRGEKATAQDPRGLYLLQYDTNADGKGKKQWRLFYENSYYFGDVA